MKTNIARVVDKILDSFIAGVFETPLRGSRIAASLLACTVLWPGFTQGQLSAPESTFRKVLLVADNQEHMLTGASLKSHSWYTDIFITSVGLRSPLANVGGRLLLKDTIRFGLTQGAGLVLHLGDATDISCKDELDSVFRALDAEAPDMWFMTPGNHDGFQSGNFARYQNPESRDPRRPSFYFNAPLDGYGGAKNKWYYACQSPTPGGNNMPRGVAIALYFEKLITRYSDGSRRPISDKSAVFVDGKKRVEVPCQTESLEVRPKSTVAMDRFQVIARRCTPKPVPPKNKTTVGNYAGFIVQRIDIGETRFVLLDSADYDEPTKKITWLIPIAAQTGALTDEQKDAVDQLLGSDSKDRSNVIMAGITPLMSFRRRTGIGLRSVRDVTFPRMSIVPPIFAGIRCQMERCRN